jgi:fucokinase
MNKSNQLGKPPAISSLRPVVIIVVIGCSRGDNLSGYLRNVLGSNIEIACISDLPAGSGLGGSSILAATILASIAELFRISLKNEALMDYVGYVEQILTTGGGWQDQIGGCFGGFKWSRSTDALPLTLSIRSFLFSQEQFLDIFQQRAFLIYTGKQVRFLSCSSDRSIVIVS